MPTSLIPTKDRNNIFFLSGIQILCTQYATNDLHSSLNNRTISKSSPVDVHISLDSYEIAQVWKWPKANQLTKLRMRSMFMLSAHLLRQANKNANLFMIFTRNCRNSWHTFHAHHIWSLFSVYHTSWMIYQGKFSSFNESYHHCRRKVWA